MSGRAQSTIALLISAVLLYAAVGLSVRACATPPPIACDLFPPITISEEDKLTPETARQILEHNTMTQKLCR